MTNRLTPEQIDSFLARHRDPADARKFLQDAGLIDENGELTEPYRPERITLLSQENFDALEKRLSKAGGYDAKVARVLTKPAPWDNEDAMDELRIASADVSNVKLNPDWVQKAGKKHISKKAQAIFDAYCTEADRRDHSVSDGEMLAAALRETINQTQNGQGMISAAELHLIASKLDVAEDDIDLYLQQ